MKTAVMMENENNGVQSFLNLICRSRQGKFKVYIRLRPELVVVDGLAHTNAGIEVRERVPHHVL